MAAEEGNGASDNDRSGRGKRQAWVKKGTKYKMSCKEELQELKTKARALQDRLDLLKMRIKKLRQGAPAPSQWKAFVDVETCMGCGICQQVCPVGAIAIEGVAMVDAQRCIGCGRCVQECPKGAISLWPSSPPAQYQARSSTTPAPVASSSYRNFKKKIKAKAHSGYFR